MDDTLDLPSMVEDLEANIDDLSETLRPLLSTPLSDRASKLPLLDKAKLYVHAAYAIESLIFSALQASGINAKEHPIFAELARLKGYFKKIKDAELGPVPRARIDKEAVGRFIKHGLAGNDRFEAERVERVSKEKAKANLLERKMHVKFDQEEEDRQWRDYESKKRKVEESSAVEEEHGVSSENEEIYGPDLDKKSAPIEPARKKQRITAADMIELDSPPSTTEIEKKKSKTKKHSTEEPAPLDLDNLQGKTKKQHKAERRARKEQRRAEKAARKGSSNSSPIVHRTKQTEGTGEEAPGIEETIFPKNNSAPRTHSETFQALLQGSFSKKAKKS